MYKISELIGKKAITLVDAKNRGIILGAYFNKPLTKLKYFSLLDEGDESTFFVEYKKFSSLFGDAAVVGSDEDLADKPASILADSPINLAAFNQDGKELGIIRDIIMDESSVVSFVTDLGEIAAGTLLSRSISAAVFNDTGKPIKIKTSGKAGGKTGGRAGGTLSGGKAGDSEGEFGKTSTKPANSHGFADGGGGLANNSAAEISTPYKFFGEPTQPNPLAKYAFLLGKRLQRTVVAKDGKLVAKENDLVTEDIIRLAKDHGMLVAVALHSL